MNLGESSPPFGELEVDPPPSESRRQNAMKRWLARADISSHKNEYLAEIYATKP